MRWVRCPCQSGRRRGPRVGARLSPLSTDQVKAFKPDPRAYQMGIDAFKLRRDEIAFAAFAGWDAAGAKSFGYPTFWVNRQNAVEEELGAHPDAAGTLDQLVKFVGPEN